MRRRRNYWRFQRGGVRSRDGLSHNRTPVGSRAVERIPQPHAHPTPLTWAEVLMRRTRYVIACGLSLLGACVGDVPPDPPAAPPDLVTQPERVSSATLVFGPEAIWAGSDVFI